jgi:hypothetical protein
MFSVLRRLLLDKELEEKRIEAEAHRQEAQRQHEIRLLSMMSQQMACVLKVSAVYVFRCHQHQNNVKILTHLCFETNKRV